MAYRSVRREMELFFGDDARRIGHALEVASHALRIQAAEGGDGDIVTMASLLHDVGIKPAEERYGSSTPGKIATKEFACLWDADFIVNLREAAPKMNTEKLACLIDGKLLTDEGKRIAREIFLS